MRAFRFFLQKYRILTPWFHRHHEHPKPYPLDSGKNTFSNRAELYVTFS